MDTSCTHSHRIILKINKKKDYNNERIISILVPKTMSESLNSGQLVEDTSREKKSINEGSITH